MEGDPRVDKLMLPVKAAIERHIKDRDAKTDIYNRAYEALAESMDALDVSARVTAKQIAENAKNLQRAVAAEAKVKELEAEQRWIPVSERLPNESNTYLVYSPVVPDGAGTKVWQVAYYAWKTPKMEFTTGYTVTHWMPLPKPPKPEEEVEG